MLNMDIKVWARYIEAAENVAILTKMLHDVREELEYITEENADELFAKTEELLREYENALTEFRVCDYAGNYTNVIDIFVLNAQRECMIKILRCATDTDSWSREQIADLAKNFLKDSGLE